MSRGFRGLTIVSGSVLHAFVASLEAYAVIILTLFARADVVEARKRPYMETSLHSEPLKQTIRLNRRLQRRSCNSRPVWRDRRLDFQAEIAMNCVIRPETPNDVAAIEAATAGALSVSLVAEAEGAVVGHVAVSPVTISDGTIGWYGLGPISVLPAWQGRGVGSALMRAALEALRETGAAGCVVLGEPAYYGRFGFKAEPGLVLPDIPPEYFQAILLAGVNLPCGEVSYHEAFNAQE